MKNIFAVIFFLVSLNVDLFGQTLTDTTTIQLDSISTKTSLVENSQPTAKYNFFRSLGQNLSEQAKAPFSMTNEQLLYFGAGVVITGTLIYYDQKIDNVFSPLGKKHKLIRRSSPQITEIGGMRGIIAMGIFGAYSLIWNDKKAQQTTLLLSEAFITSGVWIRIGKIVFSRERPQASYEFSHKNGGKWYGIKGFFDQRFESVTQHDAFPSGHTASAFAMAAVIAEEYGEYSFVPPIVYTIASTVAVTRMIEHTHWASDIFVGGVIGYLCGKQVVHHYHEQYEPKGIQTNISLGVVGNNPGLVFSVKL